jgi:DNA-binding transcriptional ArsR family regulator
MGWWVVSTDTLAGSRFVVSPLAETTSALQTLHRGTAAHPGERAWLDAHLASYRARLAADPVAATLVSVGLGRSWNADFLTPTPTGESRGFAAEVDAIRAAEPPAARADLRVSLGGGALPPVLERDDLPARAAELMTWVWTETVLPTWPTRRRIIEADIVARTHRLGQAGWAAVLNDVRPSMRWLGESRLQINAQDYPPRSLDGAQLFFVPVTPRAAWVMWEGVSRYAVVYPCAGVLAEADRVVVPEALGRLLGPARATVLVLLGQPKTTTQLVALTGQGLGSVGRHLKVLLDARLVGRRRAGRSVLYYRRGAGDTLIDAQGND